MKKKNVYYQLLVSAYSLSTFSEAILVPIYAVFVQKVGGDILDAAGAIATFYVVCGLGEIFIHRTTWSKNHRLALMFWGWFIWLGGVVSFLFISNIATLFLAQILTALGNAIANPAYDAELAEHTDNASREKQYGYYEGIQDIFQGIAALVGGVLAFAYGFKLLIVVMILTATVSFGLSAVYLRKIKNDNNLVKKI
jgi:MFS family permease